MTPTLHDAALRALVRLPDGTVGRLHGVTRRTGMAKVLVEGRYRRLPARMLTTIDESNACMLVENRRGTALLVTASAPLAETTTITGGPVG